MVVSLVALDSALAEAFKVIRTEFIWHSSNWTELQVSGNLNIAMSENSAHLTLGYLTHDRYFEQHGTSPPLNFIQPLKRGSSSTAHLSGKQIIFSKFGLKRSLKTNIFPSGADPAAPYLVGVPDSNLVLIVYPYYFYGCKEDDHIVEVYSEFGSLLHTFDSLLTHVLNTNPNILISPDKSGCCDSLR